MLQHALLGWFAIQPPGILIPWQLSCCCTCSSYSWHYKESVGWDSILLLFFLSTAAAAAAAASATIQTRRARIGPHHFLGSTGYGHGDLGREALDQVGVHAVACLGFCVACFGVLWAVCFSKVMVTWAGRRWTR
jgi:hypothetical protein